MARGIVTRRRSVFAVDQNCGVRIDIAISTGPNGGLTSGERDDILTTLTDRAMGSTQDMRYLRVPLSKLRVR